MNGYYVMNKLTSEITQDYGIMKDWILYNQPMTMHYPYMEVDLTKRRFGKKWNTKIRTI